MRQPEFGRTLTKIRNQKGMTQEELATKSNVTIRTIQRIESGFVNPRSYTVKSLGEILDYDFLSDESLQDDRSNYDDKPNENGATEGFSKGGEFAKQKINTMSKFYLIPAFLILALSWMLAFIPKGGIPEPRHKQTDNKTVIEIYGSQSNRVTVNYRFKNAQFEPLIKQHKFRLIQDISNHWVNSNIKLDADKTYFIIVNGLASTNSEKSSLWIGPEGKKNLFDGLPMYSVIGKIGSEKPFSIGRGTEVKPAKKELFYFLTSTMRHPKSFSRSFHRTTGL